MALPTERTKPTLQPATAKVLLFGQPKVGKSTLAANFDPEHTLFVATEPGQGALDIYVTPCGSWSEFLDIGSDLAGVAKDKPDVSKRVFHTVVIDTVDELYKQCQDHVMHALGAAHPSDLEYGKGYGALLDEFRVKVAKLAGLGYGVWFVSHATERDVKVKTGAVTKEITKVSSQLSGKAGAWLEGFVDFILLAEIEQGEDGQRRVLRTEPTENYEVGGRVPLPNPLPLDAPTLRREIQTAFDDLTGGKNGAK